MLLTPYVKLYYMLYIPHCSDETVSSVTNSAATTGFTSHIVQMKPQRVTSA